MEEWITLIGTLGFPIAMCLLMWQDKRTTTKELTKAVNNNTTVLTLIKEKLK